MEIPARHFTTSAIDLNSIGFQLYEEGRYREAANYFAHSAAKDRGYLFAPYNLACMLALEIDNDALNISDPLEVEAEDQRGGNLGPRREYRNLRQGRQVVSIDVYVENELVDQESLLRVREAYDP